MAKNNKYKVNGNFVSAMVWCEGEGFYEEKTLTKKEFETISKIICAHSDPEMILEDFEKTSAPNGAYIVIKPSTEKEIRESIERGLLFGGDARSKSEAKRMASQFMKEYK